MKKLSYIYGILCVLLLWGCNTIDLSDIGYGDGDRLKSSTLKAALLSKEGCWKADYQGHTFYFRFHKDGTVALDSDFQEFTVSGNISCSTSGKNVEIQITNCDVHLGLLGNGLGESKFIVSEVPGEGETESICLVGVLTGNTIELMPTTEAEIINVVEPKIESLIATNMAENKVVCDGFGNLIAYYATTQEDNGEYSIKVLTIENKSGNDERGHTQYYESKLSREGNTFRLLTPIDEIKSVNGKTYFFKAIDFGAAGLELEGMPNVSVISNAGAVEDFDYVTAKKQFSFGSAQTKGAACEEIWNCTGGSFTEGGSVADINLMEYDYGWANADCTQRPLIIWTWWFVNLVWRSSEPGANIRMNDVDTDLIHFTNLSGNGENCGGGRMTDQQVKDLNEYAKPLLDTWFSEKGLFVARVNRLGVGDKFYIYLLSPDTNATSNGGMWMKMQRKEE